MRVRSECRADGSAIATLVIDGRRAAGAHVKNKLERGGAGRRLPATPETPDLTY